MKKVFILFTILFLIFFRHEIKNGIKNASNSYGESIDKFNNVSVFFNGKISNAKGRNVSKEYNLGLKWQCVEFVKRYYFEHYNHKMPNSYGHAKDFYETELKDGAYNKERDLIQFTNPSKTKPSVGEIIVFKPTYRNKFGHVAIISEVTNKDIEIIQQNTGLFGRSRERIPLHSDQNKKYLLKNKRIIGRLKK